MYFWIQKEQIFTINKIEKSSWVISLLSYQIIESLKNCLETWKKREKKTWSHQNTNYKLQTIAFLPVQNKKIKV